MLRIQHGDDTDPNRKIVEVPDILRELGQSGIDEYVELVGSGTATPAEALAQLLPPPPAPRVAEEPELEPEIEVIPAPPTLAGGTD
jgi:hypothetical protein